MNADEVFSQTEALTEAIAAILPTDYGYLNKRTVTSGIACSLSLEHWNATKSLLTINLLPSAVVVHRTQFEAVVRSIWLFYAASETEVERLTAKLSKESEQGAKNIAGLQEMIADIEKRGPREAFLALSRFRDNALKPINSYVHTGVHPLHRHAFGYPAELALALLKNSNGVAVLSWMQSVALAGRTDLQRVILAEVARYKACMPAPI